MGFRSTNQFIKYQQTFKLPLNIPTNPRLTYKEYEGDTIFFGKRAPRYLTYLQGRELVRSLKLTSTPQYFKHVAEHETHKTCYRLPRRPDMLKSWEPYWTGWNDFLNTNNKSPSQRRAEFLSYEEAKAFVHQLKLKSRAEWDEWAATSCPSFLPKLPERTYSDQFALKDWLGLDVVSALETRMEQPGVWAILWDSQDARNVFQLRTFKGGRGESELYAKQHNLRIIRMYTYEYEFLPEVQRVISQNSSSFVDHTFVATNFNQLRFDLDMMLLIVN